MAENKIINVHRVVKLLKFCLLSTAHCILPLLTLHSCTKKTSPTSTSINSYIADDLNGTKWRLFQYKLSTATNPTASSDTLIFNTNGNYTYNHQAFTYILEKSEYYNNCRLTLNNTPFGNVVGYPAFDFKTYGTINDISFAQLTVGNPPSYNFWLQKF